MHALRKATYLAGIAMHQHSCADPFSPHKIRPSLIHHRVYTLTHSLSGSHTYSSPHTRCPHPRWDSPTYPTTQYHHQYSPPIAAAAPAPLMASGTSLLGFRTVSSTLRIKQAASVALWIALILTRAGSHTKASKVLHTPPVFTSTPKCYGACRHAGRCLTRYRE